MLAYQPQRETQVSAITVDSYGAAWRVLDLLAAGEKGLKLSFKDCFIDVQSTSRIAMHASASAGIILQRAFRAQYSLLKYGKRNARLDARDKELTEVIPRYHPNGRMIRYDISAPLNAMATVVEEWDEHGPVHIDRTMSLFAAPRDKQPEESWRRTVREGVVAFFNGMKSADKRELGKFAVLAIAASWLGYQAIKLTIDMIDEPVTAYVQQQLLGPEPTRVVTADGKEAKLPAKQIAQVEHDIEARRQRAQLLIADNVEQPLLRFVVAEVETARPALLAMAPDSGNITINGETFIGPQAKAAATKLRKHSKRRRQEGWQTTVIGAPNQDA